MPTLTTIEVIQDEATRSADDLFAAVKDASFSYLNLLSVAETIEDCHTDLKDCLVAAFSMRLCKMGPIVKADWLKALTIVALRNRN
jgi:hypothetical protein